MRGGSRAAANLGENEDAGGVARGMGRGERGWRMSDARGPLGIRALGQGTVTPTW